MRSGRTNPTALAFALVFLVLLAASSLAQAQTFATLYNFNHGKGGNTPTAGLVLDQQGNLYGTTSAGGVHGRGTLFSLTTGGSETALFTFSAKTDGKIPIAGLTLDAQGNVFGTTSKGAKNKGTAFELARDGTMTTLHSFTAKADGQYPQARLIQDSHGNLFSTTLYGGIHSHGVCRYGCGTVFELSPDGTETVLYRFTGAADGAYANSGLIQDAEGNLYGTTLAGGVYSYGTVFELTSSGVLKILYSFTGGADGGIPSGDLLLDDQGNFYGATYAGGILPPVCNLGCGVLFKLAPSGSETVLYSFTGGDDGAEPNGGLVRDAQGTMYGTARFGAIGGSGTVFALAPSGAFSVIHAFNFADGGGPNGNLVFDSLGNLYGTTSSGGAHLLGTIFKVSP